MPKSSLLLLASLLLSTAAVAENPDAEWRRKVDPWVFWTASAETPTEFLVVLEEQADLSGAANIATKNQKGEFVYRRLRETAERTQGALRAELAARGAEYRPFWVMNMIWTHGDLGLVETLARRDDVARISANPLVPMETPHAELEPSASVSAIEWGVMRLAAPTYWTNGVTGQGVVIGGQDTGFDWDHPALVTQYRGWTGSFADHDYNWHDSIHSGGGTCGADSPQPCDDSSHGTHTMGTMVGDDGGSNQVGVAPGARWIGCRNMDRGNGTPATYSECFEWFIAPTDVSGANPDPSMAPHVINNSWLCPPSEGCTDPNVLRTVVANTRAAGIVPVVSAGNGGSGCSSISSPATTYDESFTIGATNSGDGIAGFSSRGPVTVDSSNRLKPDVSAPGVAVRSTTPGGTYSSFSGTSMAGPHVAAQVAMIIAASPGIAGDVDRIEQCIRQTAMPLTSTQTCGGVPGSTIPNNTFGWGRVQLVWPPPAICQAAPAIFADGFETGDITRWSTSG